MPKTLIVDACLAVDAGSKDPPAARGQRVRRFLTAVLAAQHRLGFSAELEAEWKEHAALFARRWLTTMRARGRVQRLTLQSNPHLRGRALATAADEGVYDAMDKDWHLLLAAVSADRTVASSDDTARSYYAVAAAGIAALKTVVWVNPATHELKAWTEADAPADPEKRLGYAG